MTDPAAVERAARALHELISRETLPDDMRRPWEYLPAREQAETRTMVRTVIAAYEKPPPARQRPPGDTP